MSKRIDELENGPKARSTEFLRGMFRHNNDDGVKVLLTMLALWFEMRATEPEKKRIWKKIQDAKKNGTTVDISEWGDLDSLNWKNLAIENSDS